MDAGAIIALAGVGAGLFGAVLMFMAKIEHRMTKLETTILERLPPRLHHP